MIRRLLALTGAVALAAALSIPVLAAKPGQFVSGDVTYTQLDRNVEPWTDVWNPTQCAWDPDDHSDALPGSGYLAGGQTVTITACLIATENPPPGFGGQFAIRPNYHFRISGGPVTVRACYPVQGWCSEPVTTADFDGCWSGPNYVTNTPEVGVIPDSNGGRGLMSSWVLSLSNPSPRRSPTLTELVEGGNDQDYCPGRPRLPVTGSDWMLWQQ